MSCSPLAAAYPDFPDPHQEFRRGPLPRPRFSPPARRMMPPGRVPNRRRPDSMRAGRRTSQFRLESTGGLPPNRTTFFSAMHLADILTPAQIIPEMRATNRWEAIDELVEQLAIAGRVKPDHR